jgi:putative glutathione S-transferase
MPAHTALDEMTPTGAFIRTAAAFREVLKPDGEHPPAAGRYHLYVAYACPWAAGALSMLYLKGLDDAVGVSAVHPTWARTRPDDPADAHTGWHFRAPGDPPVPNSAGYGANVVDDACTPDTVNGCATVRELYELAKDTNGKYTTPILWDKATSTIVSNESTDILRILNAQLDAYATRADADLYPAELEAETAALNAWIYPTINDGVYRSGFARTQAAYDDAVRALFASLDRCEELLATRRYLTGPKFTWVDLRLFHTLVRFDPVYVTYFKTNLKRLADYVHLPNYVRDIYQIGAVRRSINLAHIKMHYFTSHPALNTYGIVPAYDGIDLDAAHGREALEIRYDIIKLHSI